MKIIGIENTSFPVKNGDTGERRIVGKNIFLSSPIPKENGFGVKVQRIFLSESKLLEIQFTPTLGSEIELYYNRYGRVIRAVSLDNDDDAPIEGY